MRGSTGHHGSRLSGISTRVSVAEETQPCSTTLKAPPVTIVRVDFP